MEKWSAVLFFKIAHTLHMIRGKIRHIAWLSSFLFKIQCFYQDENDLASDDQYYIRGKMNTVCFGNMFEKR